MSTTQIPRPASAHATPIDPAPGGTQDTQQANVPALPNFAAPAGANSRPAMWLAIPNNDPPGGTNDTQQARTGPTPIGHAPAGADSRPAKLPATPRQDSPGGAQHAGSQTTTDAHIVRASGAQRADRQPIPDAQRSGAVGSDAGPGLAAIGSSMPIDLALLDPALCLAADVLDDIERVKIANENRLRQLTRSVEDADGEVRGFGLDESHPDVARLAAIVESLARVEHDATLQLQRQLRKHPLGPWMASQKGIGEKQGARLLAAIGDPYIRPRIEYEDGRVLAEGPRTVSALWAYCGYHVLPIGDHTRIDNHMSRVADRADLPAGQIDLDVQAAHASGHGGDPSHSPFDAHAPDAGVAPKRARGAKANWNATAKMRAYLVAEKVIQCGNPGYRDVYDKRKAATEDRVHVVPCVRCGPKGKPAPAGSPWSKAHRHADALRVVAKEILKDLWLAARDLRSAP